MTGQERLFLTPFDTFTDDEGRIRDDLKAFNGQLCEVLSREPDADSVDVDVPGERMYRARFPDGTVTTVWASEIGDGCFLNDPKLERKDEGPIDVPWTEEASEP